MNILKQIQQFNPKKELKSLEKNNASQYNLFESIYNSLASQLNKDFYLSENYKNFYLERFYDNFIDIQCFHQECVNQCEELENLYNEITTKYKDMLPEEEYVKMCNFCVDALKLNLKIMTKVSELSKINSNTIIFMEKYLIDVEFRLFIRQDINVIPIYAKSVNELGKVAKEHQMKIISNLQPVFNRAKACKSNENAFILVTQKELDSLKSYNYILKEPVNFPVWEIDHYKDITFKDGKAEGIFTEFTPFV